MNVEEQMDCEEEAKRQNETDTEGMDEKEKQELIKKYKKRLLNDVSTALFITLGHFLF